ncbi:hypothetical protein AAFN60_19185 [Roseibacillus persicicus]|uniref:hypothetical protein n=1 Tax=Roseibacillus persicicus TaxID=454148 RepID=UPI00398BA4FE
MKSTFLTFLFLLAALSTPSEGQNLIWRKAGEGSVNLQVQKHPGEAPKISVVPLSGDSSETVAEVSDGWTEMSVPGFWEYKNWSTQKLEEGLYRLVIEKKAEEASGFLKSPGQFETIRASFDYKKNAITWTQLQSGPSRLLVQFASGLTIAEPASWEIRADGQHEVKWNFQGEDGLDYAQQPAISATAQIASFQNDILIVGQPEFEEDFLASLGVPEDRYQCDLKVMDEEGMTLEHPTPGALLRVSLKPETKPLLVGKRFEILIYLDGVFLHEESQGVSPYTYILPTTLPADAKILTVNILDYEGNWGVSSLQFQTPLKK